MWGIGSGGEVEVVLGEEGVWSGWSRLNLIEVWKHGDQFGSPLVPGSPTGRT